MTLVCVCLVSFGCHKQTISNDEKHIEKPEFRDRSRHEPRGEGLSAQGSMITGLDLKRAIVGQKISTISGNISIKLYNGKVAQIYKGEYPETLEYKLHNDRFCIFTQNKYAIDCWAIKRSYDIRYKYAMCPVMAKNTPQCQLVNLEPLE